MSIATLFRGRTLCSPLARLATLWLVATLSACGGGGGETAAPAPPAPPAPPHTVGVSITSTVASGETFRFALQGSTPAVALTAGSTTATFSTALASGSSYTVAQTEGPRTCTLSANRTGTLSANVVVTAACGSPPASTALSGTLYAPVGAALTLQVNAGSNLALTMPPFPGSSEPYNQLAFSFTPALPDGSTYQVSVLTPPPGQSCSVYAGASGTTPVGSEALKVGCEFIFDHVSRNSDSTVRGTFFESSALAIGGAATAIGNTLQGYGDGRFVAFVSSAAGMAGASGARRQVFWRDRYTGITRLVSAAPDGSEGNADSFAPAVSADGLTVVFESHATNLVAGDTNAVRDVFIWSAVAATNALERISVGPAGVQANAESYGATVSGDGRVVAFNSGASNLTAGVVGTSTINVIRRDRTSSTNTLISATPAGVGVGGSQPVLSEDGQRLAFYSFSAQITAGDGNGLWDIFVYDHGTGLNSRVSLTSTGSERDQGNESASRVVAPAISGNGRFVAYATTATNLVAGDTNGLQDVFVVDTETGAVTRVSIGAAGAQGNGDSPVGQGERVSLSRDGSWVAYSSNASNLGAPPGNALMHNRVTGETRAISSITGGSAQPPVLSREALYVGFGASTALDPRCTNSGLFVHFTGLGRAYLWP